MWPFGTPFTGCKALKTKTLQPITLHSAMFYTALRFPILLRDAYLSGLYEWGGSLSRHRFLPSFRVETDFLKKLKNF